MFKTHAHYQMQYTLKGYLAVRIRQVFMSTVKYTFDLKYYAIYVVELNEKVSKYSLFNP